jgi:hypothetical protein
LKKNIQLTTAHLPSKEARGRMAADNDPITELEYLTLKVLEEYDEDRREWVATCVETGAVATAHDQGILQKLIQDTIRLEILLAIQKDNFANLFRRPASGEVHARWLRAAGLTKPLKEKLEISYSLSTPRREVKSEISIAKASYPRTA